MKEQQLFDAWQQALDHKRNVKSSGACYLKYYIKDVHKTFFVHEKVHEEKLLDPTNPDLVEAQNRINQCASALSTLVNLSDCWQIFRLKSSLTNSLSERYTKFEAWINNPDIHSITSLFNAIRSSLKPEKKTFKNKNANELQNLYIDQITHSHQLDVTKAVKEYFKPNWYKSFLITKDVTQFYAPFGNQDIVNSIAEALFESYEHDGFKIELAGE